MKSSLAYFAAILILAVPLVKQQTSTPSATSEATQSPAPIPLAEEHHHHLVFENSYVRVYYVEIPPHDATLLHTHSLPYISFPPTGAGDASAPPAAGPSRFTGFRANYTLGGFSHIVTNSSDRTMRNVAVELLRPQGTVHNLCDFALKDEPAGCEALSTIGTPVQSIPSFETDEILVERWTVTATQTGSEIREDHDILLGAAIGISSIVNAANTSSPELWIKGGLLWIPAGHVVMVTADSRGGQFATISFKDSSPLPTRE